MSQSVSDDSELEYRLMRVTLLPGIGTNGLDAGRFTARYSLNLLAGYHGALDGFEIGPVNVNRFYSRGAQLGGLNLTGGDMSGIHLSALANAAHGDMSGVQISTLVNYSTSNLNGIQFAGFANVANHTQGLQVSGFGNFSRMGSSGLKIASFGNFSASESTGFQLSGFLNVSDVLRGITISGFMNSANQLQGVQIAGIANASMQAEGIQIAPINVARNFSGVPIGLLSLYGNGRYNIDTWFSDGGFTQIGFKTGTQTYYNIFSFGYNPTISERDVWSLGWTFGSFRKLDEWWDSQRFQNYFRMSDFSIYQMHEGEIEFEQNRIFSYRFMLGRFLARGLGIYAGPSANLQVTTEESASDYSWYSLLDITRSGRTWRFWVGFSAGFQFF